MMSASRHAPRAMLHGMSLIGVMQECLEVVAMSADVGNVNKGLEGQLALHIESPVLDGAGTVDLRLKEKGVALPVHDRGVDEGRQVAGIGG